MNRERIILDIILLALIATGIAPLVALVMVIGVFRYVEYAEAFIAGWMFELLYGTGTFSQPFPYPMFLGAVILYVIAATIKGRLR